MAAGAALGLVEAFYCFERDWREPGDDELSDAVAMVDDIPDAGTGGVEGDHDFAAVVGIEGAESGDDALSRKSAARADLGVETGWDGHGQAGRDHDRVLSHFYVGVEAGVKVDAGGTGCGAKGEAGSRAQQLHENSAVTHIAQETGEQMMFNMGTEA